MTSKWISAPVPLKFRLGEITLFQHRMQMRVLPSEVISIDEPPGELEEPHESLQDGEKAYLARSLPLPSPQPVVSARGEFLYYVPDQFNRYYVDLRQSFEDYAAKFSSKTRSTIRRKIKKFSAHCGGEIHWERYATADQITEFYDHARAVSSKSYQEQLLDCGLPENESFRSEMLQLAEAERARGYVLFDNDRPVAYLFCPITDGVLLYQFLGYDLEYTKWSVGTILQWFAFESIFNEDKFKLFDFTEGHGEHKRMFSTDGLWCGNVYVFPKRFSNWLLVHAHRATDTFSNWLGDTLDRIGLKAKIKKLIRSRGRG